MSKLTLASLAVLCTLFISCSKQELDVDANLNQSLASRSIENEIAIKYTKITGGDTTIMCTRATVDYRDAFSADITLEFVDNSTFTVVGNNIFLSVSEGYVLDVTTQSNLNYVVSDFSASACGNNLCYNSISGEISGTTLGFIVEDESIGF